MSEETTSHQTDNDSKDYLTVTIAEQRFGIPILQVQDVLREQTVTNIPLAPKEVAGSLNLRGRIVTAIDVRKRLGLPDKDGDVPSMSVVVEHNNELFSLIIDSVGDVLRFKDKYYENNPGTLDPVWRDVSTGIYQLEEELLVVMDVSRLLEDVSKLS